MKIVRGLAAVAIGLFVLGARADGGTRSGSASAVLPAPGLIGSPNWLAVTTGPNGSHLAPQLWAITARTDLRALQPLNLSDGLRFLEPRGIVLWATTTGRGGPTSVFTRDRLPLRLSTFRLDRLWEGQPKRSVEQRLRWVAVGGWRLDVRVYFGTQRPDQRLIAAAQAEIARLRIPHG